MTATAAAQERIQRTRIGPDPQIALQVNLKDPQLTSQSVPQSDPDWETVCEPAFTPSRKPPPHIHPLQASDRLNRSLHRDPRVHQSAVGIQIQIHTVHQSHCRSDQGHIPRRRMWRGAGICHRWQKDRHLHLMLRVLHLGSRWLGCSQLCGECMVSKLFFFFFMDSCISGVQRRSK